MPDLAIHELLSNILFGDKYTKTHNFFDVGRYCFPGIIHRFFPPHDPLSALCYAILKCDFIIILVYIQHIIQDSLQFLFLPFSLAMEKILIHYLKKGNNYHSYF